MNQSKLFVTNGWQAYPKLGGRAASAEPAARKKIKTNAKFLRGFDGIPLALENHGPLAKASEVFLRNLGDLGKKIRQKIGKSRAGTNLEAFVH